MKYIFTVLLLFAVTACSNIKKDNEKSLKNTNHKTSLGQIAPKIKYTDVQKTLGEATTRLLDKNKNRIENIRLAINKINQMTIENGDRFSFNNTVGKRSAENGFKEAPIIKEGKHDTGVGGGVCQVSSALYMAAKNAGLKITERHSHTKPVPYADKNNDATVVFGVKDFGFENTSEFPLTLYLWIENDILYAKIVSNEKQVVYE